MHQYCLENELRQDPFGITALLQSLSTEEVLLEGESKGKTGKADLTVPYSDHELPEHSNLLLMLCQILADFQNFFTIAFFRKLAMKCPLNITSHFKRVATLPYKILKSEHYLISEIYRITKL